MGQAVKWALLIYLAVAFSALFSLDMPGLYSLVMKTKENAFEGIDTIISCATLLIGIASIVAIIRTTMDIVSGRQVADFKPIRFIVVGFIVMSFNTFVLKPIDWVSTTVAEGLGEYWNEAWNESDILGAFADRNDERVKRFTENVTAIFGMDGQLTSGSGGTTTEQMVADITDRIENMAAEPEEEVSFKGFLNWIKEFFQSVGGALASLFDILTNVIDLGVMGVLGFIVSIIAQLTGIILCIFSGLYLTMIGLIGPFVFALSIIPGFESGIIAWISRYIQVSFWYPLTMLAGSLSTLFHSAYFSAGGDVSSVVVPGITSNVSGSLILIIADFCVIALYFSIPSLSKWIINSSGADGVDHRAVIMGQSVSRTMSRMITKF